MLTKRMGIMAACAGALLVVTAGAALANSSVILSKGVREQMEAENFGPGMAAEETLDANLPLCIWGPVLEVQEDLIVIDNQSEKTSQGEMVVRTGWEGMKLLDAVNGYPVQQSDVKEGEIIYAYVGQQVALSLPPQVSAELVLCQVPDDGKVPAYVVVTSVEEQGGGAADVTGADGTVYHVDGSSMILPYLTRNIVTLSDISKGSRCLVWGDESQTVEKLVLFADGE